MINQLRTLLLNPRGVSGYMRVIDPVADTVLKLFGITGDGSVDDIARVDSVLPLTEGPDLSVLRKFFDSRTVGSKGVSIYAHTGTSLSVTGLYERVFPGKGLGLLSGLFYSTDPDVRRNLDTMMSAALSSDAAFALGAVLIACAYRRLVLQVSGEGIDGSVDVCSQSLYGTDGYCACMNPSKPVWCEGTSSCVVSKEECCEDQCGDTDNSCYCACVNADTPYWCSSVDSCVADDAACFSAFCGFSCGGTTNNCYCECVNIVNPYWCAATESCVASKAECCEAQYGTGNSYCECVSEDTPYWCAATESCVYAMEECCYNQCGTPTNDCYCACMGASEPYWSEGLFRCVGSAEKSCEDQCGGIANSCYCECVSEDTPYWCEGPGLCMSGKEECCGDPNFDPNACACLYGSEYWFCIEAGKCVVTHSECCRETYGSGTDAYCSCLDPENGYWCAATNECVAGEAECEN